MIFVIDNSSNGVTVHSYYSLSFSQENCPVVMRKNTKHWSVLQRKRFLKVLMSYVVHVLVLETLDWQISDSARFTMHLVWLSTKEPLTHILKIWGLHPLHCFRYSLTSLLRQQNLSVLFHWFLAPSRCLRLNLNLLLCFTIAASSVLMISSSGCSCWWPLSAWSCHYVQEGSTCWACAISFWTPCFTRRQAN